MFLVSVTHLATVMTESIGTPRLPRMSFSMPVKVLLGTGQNGRQLETGLPQVSMESHGLSIHRERVFYHRVPL